MVEICLAEPGAMRLFRSKPPALMGARLYKQGIFVKIPAIMLLYIDFRITPYIPYEFLTYVNLTTSINLTYSAG